MFEAIAVSLWFFWVLWVICAAISGVIGERKGRPITGVVLGVLLGIIGMIVMLIVSESTEKRVQKEELTRRQMGAGDSRQPLN